MNNTQCTTETQGHCHFKLISWSAIIVGALVGVGLGFLLNLFSIAIGLSIVTNTQEGFMTVATGGVVGLLIGTVACMFTSGFAAGSLAKPYYHAKHLGLLYGFTTWSLALILTVLLTSHIGHYVSGYSNFVMKPVTYVIATEGKADNAVTVAIETQKAEKTLGSTTMLIFVLFFVGAISSCFGAHCGMCCKKDHMDNMRK